MLKKIALTLLLALAAPTLASAQTTPAKKAPPTYRMPKLVVEGHPPGPGAVYVLERSSAPSDRKLSTSFVRQIVKSVAHDPF